MSSPLARRREDEDKNDDAYLLELCKGLTELLKDEKIKAAIAAWLTAQANKTPPKILTMPYYAGLLFGLFIFAGIVAMAWYHILSSETTTVLIGALIAAWWGGQKLPPK